MEAFPDFVAMKPSQTRTCAGALRRGGAPHHRYFGPIRFMRDRRAGAAVDFALTLFPFLMVLMVMINSALILLAGQYIERVTGRFFEPPPMTLLVDGSGGRIQLLGHPIIAINSV